ncbi:sensor histidine kinase [Streptomyces sp. O3]
MNETATATAPTPPAANSPRSDVQLLRVGLRAIREDLLSGMLAVRPQPPLAADGRLLHRTPARLRPYARWLPHAAVALLAVLVGVVRSFTNAPWDPWSYSDTDGRIMGLVAAVAVVLTLFRPVAAFWLSFALVAATEGSTYVLGALAHLVVMVLVALRSRPRVAAGMMLLTLVLGVFLGEWGAGYGDELDLVMLLFSALALGAAVAVRGWSSARHEVAAKEEVTLAERSQRTLLEERTTIARELHDVVAHHMSVVAVQAEAAPYRVENPPPELERAFATIRENAVAALTELRRVLGVVRAADYEAPDAPQPTLANLDGLLTGVRDAGLRVEKTVTGAVRELPQGVELSAYRIVQEALSNALRHAPGASAAVEISYVLGGLGLRVVNGPSTGLVKPSPGAGHGITGMRERVTMLNGEMTAGPTDDGGYEVAVFLPVAAAAREGRA